MTENCGSCTHFGKLEKNKTGTCYRFPPVPIVRPEEETRWDQPEVYDFQWCGEWKEGREPAEILYPGLFSKGGPTMASKAKKPMKGGYKKPAPKKGKK
jgi:hypothetical protein